MYLLRSESRTCNLCTTRPQPACGKTLTPSGESAVITVSFSMIWGFLFVCFYKNNNKQNKQNVPPK